jgi:amino acid transporter
MTKRSLTVWGLIMINLAALGGIRAWAPMAECGFPVVFFLILACLVFFLPVALVAAELATALPKAGGVYVWVKEAFGHRLGFLAIWLLWIENVMWYPTVLSFIASTVTFVFDPSLIHNPFYTVALVLAIFWATTLINLKGVKVSTWLSSLGAICGTFIAGGLIVIFGLIWFFKNEPTQISFDWKNWLPQTASFSQWALFAGVILSFLGIEMSAVHASEVKNPQRNYPRAIFLSALFVILFSVLGVLSIAMVVPHDQIVLSAGGLQAFSLFFESFGLTSLLPIMSLIIALGALGSMSTWIVGPCVGLIAAAKEEDMPAFLKATNRHGVPQNILLFQAILVSILASLFLFMPTVNSAYWVFVVLTTQLYLMMYILLFAAGIKLRYKRPDLVRPFKIPGKVGVMWCVGGVGILSAAFTAIVGFSPPSQIAPGQGWGYVLFLGAAILFFTALPFAHGLINKKKTAPK